MGRRRATIVSLAVFCCLIIAVYVPAIDWIVSRGKNRFDARSSFNLGHRGADRYSLDGLLVGSRRNRRDEDQCYSRLEQHLYRRKNVPSPYLVQRLRAYEEYHGYCSSLLKNGSLSDPVCKFIVWKSYSGLGNKIISIVSTFVYALLTNRVLLIDPGPERYLEKLFCEPFPWSSWFISTDFPLDKFNQPNYKLMFDDEHFCKDNRSTSNIELDRYGFLELIDAFQSLGDKFFCEHEQEILSEQVPWLGIIANLYFVPSLYNVPSFNTELEALFPEQEALFHHLVRYLIYPSNDVWDKVISYHEDHIVNASKAVGIQLRLLQHLGFTNADHEDFFQSMIKCTQQNGLLPEPIKNGSAPVASTSNRSIAAVVTSLNQDYSSKLEELYSNSRRQDGSPIVKVYSPSQETQQKVEDLEHEKKALADMFLLSLCDDLVTSPGSTFGYVAQGLSGTRPWILDRENNCTRTSSIDPCFHARVSYGCDCAPPQDALAVQHNIQSCQDVTWGIQLKSSTNRPTS